jgi:hypothetical protein
VVFPVEVDAEEYFSCPVNSDWVVLLETFDEVEGIV